MSQLPQVFGREHELDAIDAWASGVGDGVRGLLLRGEAGIGKTALWNVGVLRGRQSGARVLVCRAAQGELPLGYSGLGDLLGEVAEAKLDRMPPPLARAMARALLLADEPATVEPLAVARATLDLLRRVAAEGPVVVAVDDVQWLDASSSRALAFSARRLAEESVAFLVSVRAGQPDDLDLRDALGSRCTVLDVGGLSADATARLLRSVVDPQLPRRTVQRIHERSSGNPFLALELSRSPAGRLPESVRDLVMRRLEAAPDVARPAIDLAAVLGPSPADTLDSADGLEAAMAAGILEFADDEVRFAHPLLAAAAIDSMQPERRRELHRWAARLVSSDEDRARHAALAADRADAAVADAVESAAAGARSRGAPEAAAELMAHAVRLTPAEDRDDRDRRLMAEAEYRYLAADEAAARAIVDQLLDGGVAGALRTRALIQRALLDVDPRAAVERLEAAAREPHEDRLLAARTLSQLAWQRGNWLGDVEQAVPEALAALEAAETLEDPALLVAALTTAGLLGSVAGLPSAEAHLRRALEIVAREPLTAGDHTPRLAYAHERWWRGDWEAAARLLDDERAIAEEGGDEGLLMRLEVFRAEFLVRRGEWNAAEVSLEAALGDARDYWRIIALVHRALLRAHRGDRRALVDAAEISASPLAAAEPAIGAAAEYAEGLLAYADGRVAQAAEHMVRFPQLAASSGARALEFAPVIPETVMVLVEAGRAAEAEALGALLESRQAQLHPWGGAAVELCRGLVALGGDDTRTALGHLTASRKGFAGMDARWELAQALTAEGIGLRRAGQRRNAARALHEAVQLFEAMGAQPSLVRARAELRRAQPRPRREDVLTDAERRVAELVARGLTNREVAAALFVTPSTVEAHLTRIYAKLDVRSRTGLVGKLLREAPQA